MIIRILQKHTKVFPFGHQFTLLRKFSLARMLTILFYLHFTLIVSFAILQGAFDVLPDSHTFHFFPRTHFLSD